MCIRDREHTLQTPKDRVVQIKMWGTLPYIMKDDLQRVIDDLPEVSEPGRSGSNPQAPTAARVCRNLCTPAQNRDHLRHLRPEVSKEKLNNICSKYKNLPDNYYGGETTKFVTPDNFLDSKELGGSQVKMWEWYSGSSSVSTYLRDHHVSHLPPIDYLSLIHI